MKTKMMMLLAGGLLLNADAKAQDFKATIQNPKVKILNPWIHVSDKRNASLYMKIVNTSGKPEKLVQVRAAVSDYSEFHMPEQEDDGKTQMKKVSFFEIPREGNINLDPGGRHISLININRPLKDGETVKLDLTFEDGENVNLVVPVKIKTDENSG